MAIIHKWQSTLDCGEAVRPLLVDFKKAFYIVHHNLVMMYYGFSRTWIKVHNVY